MAISKITSKNVNERLGQFYNNNTESVNWWNYYLKVIYYILISISILLFIFRQQYKKIKMYVFFVTILLLPYLFDRYYAFIMRTFRHFKLDNIYFIFTISVITIIFTLNYVSKLPFY